MAKKKDDSIEDAEIKKGIGEQMKSKLTQRERNLAVKAELIEKGDREEPNAAPGQTIKQRNLAVKKELKEADKLVKKLAEEDEKRKPKTSG